MVYVDDMYKSPVGQFRRMKMSHMIADTKEELLQMADKIGVKRKWIQHENTYLEHFDICLSKRKLAVQNGAKEITWRELGEMTIARKRVEKNAIEVLTELQRKYDNTMREINTLIDKENTDYE